MRQSLILLFTIILVISGCSQDDKDQSITNSKAKPAPDLKLAEFQNKAWLRGELPEEALVYLRVPNLWFFYAGLDNGFKYAQGNEQHVKQLELIQKGVFDNLLSKMDDTAKPLTELLVKHMAAPLEVAVINNPQMPTMPSMILATKLDIANTAEFTSIFKTLVTQQPMLRITQETDANGQGVLMIAPMNINALYQFDEKSGRFSITAAMGADKKKLLAQLALLKPTKAHPMFKIEKKIDDSGKGLFGFINAKAIIPIAQNMAPPEMMSGLKMSGMDQLNALAFGYGTSNQKTRLKILLDMPVVGFRAYLPTANNQLDISARGQVNSVGVLSLPTEEEFKRIESTIIMMNGASPEYSQGKEEFEKTTGFSFEQILGMIGPEMVYFSDDVSNFIAVRLSNQQQFADLIKSAVDKGWIKYSEHQKDGLTIKHITSSALPFEELTDSIKENSPALGEMMANLKSHYYWIEENGYIIYSAIPQPLIERHKHKGVVSVKDWLVNSQKQDLSSAFIGFTSAQVDLSRKSYHIYLQVLHMLADVSGAEFDVFALPHAGDVGFSDKGAIGFNLDFDKNYLALEFNFEQSLFDVLYGSSYQTFAAIGILSAVAIPAYQDYITRANVESATASFAPIRNEIIQQLQAGVPSEQITISEQLTQQVESNSSSLIESINFVDGTITVVFSSHVESASLRGSSLSLMPNLNQQTGVVEWQCHSMQMTAKQYPSICQ
jgi:Tfp pilus assembly major pilin PilA